MHYYITSVNVLVISIMLLQYQRSRTLYQYSDWASEYKKTRFA